MKISFDATDDSIEKVLEVIKAVYGVDVTLGGAPEPAQVQEFEPVAPEPDSVLEPGLAFEPEAAAPAEIAPTALTAEATAPAKRPRVRSAAKPPKADTAEAGDETKAAPAKKTGSARKAAVKKTATQAPVSKPAAKKAASKKASAPRPRAASAETTAPDAAPGRGRGIRAAVTKSATVQKGASVRPEAKVVRAWAREQGLDGVPGRGTLPARIYEQYAAAHA